MEHSFRQKIYVISPRHARRGGGGKRPHFFRGAIAPNRLAAGALNFRTCQKQYVVFPGKL